VEVNRYDALADECGKQQFGLSFDPHVQSRFNRFRDQDDLIVTAMMANRAPRNTFPWMG
jgi:hypothetical protein